MKLVNKNLLCVLMISIFSAANAAECDSMMIKNQLQSIGMDTQSESDFIKKSTILAALHWVHYQDEMRQLEQSAQKLKNIEDEKAREMVGFTVIQGLGTVSERFPLASCIEREVSLKKGEVSLFSGYGFIVSDKTEAVPYIVTRETEDSLISIRTVNSVYMYNSRSKKIWNYSKADGKFVSVDPNLSRWVLNIIQKHNL